MEPFLHTRRRRVIAGLVTLALAALLCVALFLPLYQFSTAIAYPGATDVAAQSLTLFTPNFALRRTAVYLTNEPFNKVYTWYSTTFELGPEAYAQSNCILMSKSSTIGWGFEQQMSVTVCNTPKDQMMFVMRTLLFRYPRWMHL